MKIETVDITDRINNFNDWSINFTMDNIKHSPLILDDKVVGIIVSESVYCCTDGKLKIDCVLWRDKFSFLPNVIEIEKIGLQMFDNINSTYNMDAFYIKSHKCKGGYVKTESIIANLHDRETYINKKMFESIQNKMLFDKPRYEALLEIKNYLNKNIKGE